LRVFVDLTSFGVEFHCIRKDELHILGKIGAGVVFFSFQFFLRRVRSSQPAATGNAYEDVLETLGSLDDLVVAGPQFLAGEFHEFCRYNASTMGSESANICETESGI
jgi:hypothetical protein